MKNIAHGYDQFTIHLFVRYLGEEAGVRDSGFTFCCKGHRPVAPAANHPALPRIVWVAGSQAGSACREGDVDNTVLSSLDDEAHCAAGGSHRIQVQLHGNQLRQGHTKILIGSQGNRLHVTLLRSVYPIHMNQTGDSN